MAPFQLDARSLKAQVAAELERRLVSGELAVGTRLPPERSFAALLGVSRPVLHEALVDLAARGFLAIEPRRGVRVKDFYREGTLATFEAVTRSADGRLAPGILEDALAFRGLLELESTRLAALAGGGGLLPRFRALLAEERAVLPGQLETRSALDLRFHILLAQASGNRVFPLLLNSMAPVYLALIRRFYASGPDVALVECWHGEIVAALQARDAERAVARMGELLAHGARTLGVQPQVRARWRS
jgi:DNA-binding FadR family transcriptional regulator